MMTNYPGLCKVNHYSKSSKENVSNVQHIPDYITLTFFSVLHTVLKQELPVKTVLKVCSKSRGTCMGFLVNNNSTFRTKIYVVYKKKYCM